MKNLLYITLGFLLLLLAGCGTDASDSNSQFGTWHIDTKTHATWEGMQNLPAVTTSIRKSESDSSSAPDTTYFYSNDKIQATLIKSRHNKYVGDIQLNIHQDGISGIKLFDNLGDIVIVDIDNSLKPVAKRGTTLSPDFYTLKAQLDFDCNVPTDNKDLIVAVTKYQVDSVSTPPDTLAYYHLSTKGMYSTAKYLKGCN